MAVLSSFSFKKKTFRAPGFSSLFDTLSGLGVLPSDDQKPFAKIILVYQKQFLPFNDGSNFWREQSFIDNSLSFLTHLIVLEKAGQGDECSYLVPLNNRTKFSIVQNVRKILIGPFDKNQLEKMIFPTSQKEDFHIWHKHKVPLQSDLCTPDDVFIVSNKIK